MTNTTNQKYSHEEIIDFVNSTTFASVGTVIRNGDVLNKVSGEPWVLLGTIGDIRGIMEGKTGLTKL